MAVRSASSHLVWRNASARPCDNLVNSAATMSRRRVAAIRRDKKERLGPEAALAERHLNRIEALDDHDHPQEAVEQIDDRRRHGPSERPWTKVGVASTSKTSALAVSNTIRLEGADPESTASGVSRAPA